MLGSNEEKSNCEVQVTNVTKTAESGFTILELLLVLSIIVIMTAIIIPVGDKWIQTTEEEDAIQSVIVTLHSLQSYAMAHGVYTKLNFQSAGSRTMYVASVPGKFEFFRKLLPEGLNIASSSNLKAVEFHADGDIIDSGRLTLVGKSGRTNIVFQFQRGRMIISESKRIFLAGSNSDARRPYGHLWYTSSTRNKDDDSTSQQETSYARC